ncbi:hypothetical protein ACS0TY_014083 [Phlomoides rotata]
MTIYMHKLGCTLSTTSPLPTITDSQSSSSSQPYNPILHHLILTPTNLHKNRGEKMSVASPPSFPCIKPRTPSSPPPSSPSSSYSPSSSSSSSPTFKFTIRSSQAEGPFRRPVAPSPVKPVPPSPPPATSPPPPPKTAAFQDKNVITLEFQRQKAKELQEYFKQKKLEDANQGPFFGFIGKNEISNGSLLHVCYDLLVMEQMGDVWFFCGNVNRVCDGLRLR